MLKKLLFLSILLIGFSACETVVTIDIPEHEPRLVVYGLISPDSTWQIQVTRSAGTLQKNQDLSAVTNATVVIKEENNIVATLTHSGNGYYSDENSRPIAGTSYSIEVSASGFENITASAHIPDEFIHTSLIEGDWNEAEWGGLEFDGTISFNFNDPAGEENFYQLKVYKKSVEYQGNIVYYDRYFESSDQAIISEATVDIEDNGRWSGSTALFSDALFDGESYDLKIIPRFDHSREDEGDSTADTLSYRFDLTQISEDYYRYKRAYRAYQDANDNPLAEPVQIYSNIEGGFGLFTGFNTSRSTIEVIIE